MQVLQQDHVDLAHELGRAIVALHQLLGGAPRRRVDQAELARERALLVEHEPVLAAAGEVVQAHAQRADEALLARHGARLVHRDEAGLRQLAPRAPEAGGERDPEHRLQVAQSARIFLQVGLEVVRGVVILQVALLLLERLRLVELAHVERSGEPLAELAIEAARSGDEPVLEQARLDRHVVRHFGLALVDGAHAVPDFQPDVPQHAEKALDERHPWRIERARQQDEHVDVGVREELAAAVASDRDERDVRRRSQRAEHIGNDAVDEPGVAAQELRRVRPRVKVVAQRVAAAAQFRPPALRELGRPVPVQ